MIQITMEEINLLFLEEEILELIQQYLISLNRKMEELFLHLSMEMVLISLELKVLETEGVI